LFFLFYAILTDFPAAFLSRLLVGGLGDFAVKRTAVSFANPMALRSGKAALLAVGDGASAQVSHPGTKLTAFENRKLRFRRNPIFAHASAFISDKPISARAADPRQDSFGSESFARDHGPQSTLRCPCKNCKYQQ
jgi:hypothetical protein